MFGFLPLPNENPPACSSSPFLPDPSSSSILLAFFKLSSDNFTFLPLPKENPTSSPSWISFVSSTCLISFNSSPGLGLGCSSTPSFNPSSLWFISTLPPSSLRFFSLCLESSSTACSFSFLFSPSDLSSSTFFRSFVLM